MIVIIMALGLSACQSMPVQPAAQCNPICFQRCVAEDGDTGVRVQSDGNDAEAWDEIGEEVVLSLTTKLRTCEIHRQACDQCLQRLEQKKVIVL